MIALTFQPLVAEGRVLLPVGKPQTVEMDYLNTRRAIVEMCAERGWEVHKRSDEMIDRVSGDAPLAVVRSEGGLLLGVWKGGEWK